MPPSEWPAISGRSIGSASRMASRPNVVVVETALRLAGLVVAPEIEGDKKTPGRAPGQRFPTGFDEPMP